MMPDAYIELAAGIAAARERFLAVGEAVAGTVREQILNSWRRSRFSSVDVDRIDPPYRADIDLDNRLVRGAGPVLDRLERELADEPMTVVLTDPDAWVLRRRGHPQPSAGARRGRDRPDLLARGDQLADARAGPGGRPRHLPAPGRAGERARARPAPRVHRRLPP